MNGIYDLKIDLDDGITMTVNALNLQGGQYKSLFTKNLGKFCEALYQKDFAQTNFADFHAHCKLKVPFETCPYPKGKNEVTNFMVADIGNVLPPYVPGGEKWKIEVRFYKTNDELLGGYNVYAILRSEQSLLG